MKKLPGILLLCLLCNILTAQVHTAIKAGGLISSLHHKGTTSDPARVGYYAGIVAGIDLKNNFFIQPGCLYALRGYSFSAIGNNSKGRVGYGYITVPVLAGYKPSKKIALLLGPDFGYMLYANSHFNSSNVNIINNIGHRFNLDISAGMAWSATSDLALEARFNWGLTGLYKGITTDQNGTPTGTIRDGFHRVLHIGVVYNVSGRKK